MPLLGGAEKWTEGIDVLLHLCLRHSIQDASVVVSVREKCQFRWWSHHSSNVGGFTISGNHFRLAMAGPHCHIHWLMCCWPDAPCLRYTWCLWFSVWTIPNHSYRWLHIQDIYWVQICCWQKNTFFLIAKCAMFKQQKTVVAASSTSSVLAEYMCALFMGKKLFINYSQWRGGTRWWLRPMQDILHNPPLFPVSHPNPRWSSPIGKKSHQRLAWKWENHW